MSKTLLVGFVLLAILAVAAGLAIYIWDQMGDVAIGTDGLIALVLGCVGSLVLGIGLMRLVYLSHRRGYDDEAGRGPFD